MIRAKRQTKKCTGICGQTLPRKAFFKCGKYITGKCKPCYRLWMTEQEKLHPEWKRNAYQRQTAKWKSDPESYRFRNLKGSLKKRNLTPEQYDTLSKKQGDVCAICGRPNPVRDRLRRPKRLSVDHSHITGLTRGLLCDLCNWALALLEADPVWAEKALQYLAEYATQPQSPEETPHPA